MHRLIPAAVAIAALAIAPAATALGWSNSPAPRYHLAPVNVTVRGGQVEVICRSTRGIPASVSLLTWARANGSPLNAAGTFNLSQYFAGRGILVEVFSRSTTAPVCVRAITWQSAMRLRVTFKLSDANGQQRDEPIRKISEFGRTG